MNVTVTTFACAEWLRARGFTHEGWLEYIEPPLPRRITVADTQRAVCDWFGLKMMDMRSARRTRTIARPRQIGMYLARELTPRSMPEIGRIYGGRDHTTVLHACRQIEKLRKVDPELDSDVRAIRQDLEG